MPFQNNIEIVLKNIIRDRQQRMIDAFQRAGERLVPIVQDRIHKRGLKSDGTPIGEYAESTKRARQKKGLQTSFIDYVFDEVLINSQQYQTDGTTVKLAVTDASRQKVLGFLTDRFGNVDGLTADELQKFRDFFRDEYSG